MSIEAATSLAGTSEGGALRFVYETLPGRVVFGCDAIRSLDEEVERLGGSRVAILCSGSATAGARTIRELLDGRVVAQIDYIRPHVPMTDVVAARRLVDESGADAIVAIGGGSAIGLGKAVMLEHSARFIAIPTTYSGSEMTSIYGMTHDGVKRTGRDERVKPALVIYDPELTIDLPRGVTAGSIMNALGHCVEALYAEARNPVISSLALDGVVALHAGATIVVDAPTDIDGRSRLLYGAFAAGLALGAVGMAIHHRICHVLGGTFGLSHGDANSVVLPHVVSANSESEPAVMRRLGAALGADDPAGALFDLARRIGAPQRLDQLGIQHSDIDKAADLIVERAGWNPRPLRRDWIVALLEDAWTGRRPTCPHGEEKT